MNAPRAEEQPGSGVDRTVIRALLRLTPAERFDALVKSARNWLAMKARSTGQ